MSSIFSNKPPSTETHFYQAGSIEAPPDAFKLRFSILDPQKKADDSAYVRTTFAIIELAENLFAIQTDEHTDRPPEYKLSEMPLANIFIQSQRDQLIFDKTAAQVWNHQDFKPEKEACMEIAFANNQDGVPTAFNLPVELVCMLLLHGNGKYKPSEIKDAKTETHLFQHLAGRWVPTTRIWLFKLFRAFKEELLEETLLAFLANPCLSASCGESDERKLYSLLEGSSSHFFQLLLQVAQRKRMDQSIIDELTDEQKELLYDVAFRLRNPFVVKLSSAPAIEPEDFSINLIWLNKTKTPDTQKFLIADKDAHTNFVQTVNSWISKNPLTPVQIWYDGNLVSSACIARTRADITAEGVCLFRDIQSLDSVKQNPKLFNLNDTTNFSQNHVYYRVDTLRLMISLENLQDKSYDVYADLDVTPQDRRELFDPRTLEYLTKFGCVFSGLTRARYENSFHILSKDRTVTLQQLNNLVENCCNRAAQDSRNMNENQLVFHELGALILRLNRSFFPNERVEYPVKVVLHPPSIHGGGITIPEHAQQAELK